MITAYIHCAYTCAHVDTGHSGLAAGSARNDSEQGGPFGKQTLCNWAVINQKRVCFPDSDGVTTDDEHLYQSTTWAWVKFRTIQPRQILVSLSCFGCFGGPNLDPPFLHYAEEVAVLCRTRGVECGSKMATCAARCTPGFAMSRMFQKRFAFHTCRRIIIGCESKTNH